MDNVQILNGIRAVATEDYQNRIPVATKTNFKKIQAQILDYKPNKNEFLDVLTNKIGLTIFCNKMYQNPYKIFKKGELATGDSVESIFVDIINAKSFGDPFGGNEATSLIGTEKADVKVEYYDENYRHKYKVTVSDERLKKAFTSSTGLQTLVNMILLSPLNSAEYDEFLLIKSCVGSVPMKEIQLTGYKTATDDKKAKMLTKKCRELVGEFGFLKNTYNAQGVMTFTKPSEIFIMVTPSTQANLDVELLATSFHMDKAQLQGRIMLIDEFLKVNPDSATVATTPLVPDLDTTCIIGDEMLVQFYESLNVSENFRNPDTLSTNNFLHKWGSIYGCGFANAVKIKGV